MKINGKNVKSEDEILQVLADVESGNEEFAVLMRSDRMFMQTAGGELEYRNQQEHYRALEAPVEPEKIREAFLSYYREDNQYLTGFHWELMVNKSWWETIKGWFGR